MKKFKLVLLAFLGILSVDSFAQLGHHVRTHTYQGTPRYASYSDYGQYSRIGFLANELYLSRRQARRMDGVFNFYDREIDRVLRERWTNRRLKKAKLRNLIGDRDYEIRSILSRRQYSKYREIRRWEASRRDRFSCRAHGASCRSNACYNSHFDNRWNDGWSRYWDGNRRGSWERNNRQNDCDNRWDDRDYNDRNDRGRNNRGRNDDRWDDRSDDDRWDDRRGSNNDRDDRYDEYEDRYPYGKASEKKEAQAKDKENVKITDTSPSVDTPSNDEPEREKTAEEEMDEYFADEFDYGDEELDDYFADEN